MDNKNLVELIDDDSNKFIFEYIMTIDFGEKEYVVLTPMTSQVEVVQNNYEDQVVILRVEHDTNQENIYVSIDDEDELNEVFEAFCEIVTQSGEEDP
jgi:uncharacterized protein YrzB (UPF0473 family)